MIGDLVKRLLAVLDVEERVYREFLNVLQRERALMMELDARGLDDLTRRKESLVDEGRLAEESRLEVATRLAGALGIGDQPPTLSGICQRLAEEGSPLRDAHARLVALVGAVRELVDANRILGGDRLTYVQTTLGLLGRLAPHEQTEPHTYTRSSAETFVPASGRLIRRSA